MPETVKANGFSVSAALAKEEWDFVPEHQRKYALLKTFDIELAPVIALCDVQKRFFHDDGGALH